MLGKYIKGKIVKRILIAAIAALLGLAGFSDEIAREFAGEGADIIIEQVED